MLAPKRRWTPNRAHQTGSPDRRPDRVCVWCGSDQHRGCRGRHHPRHLPGPRDLTASTTALVPSTSITRSFAGSGAGCNRAVRLRHWLGWPWLSRPPPSRLVPRRAWLYYPGPLRPWTITRWPVTVNDSSHARPRSVNPSRQRRRVVDAISRQVDQRGQTGFVPEPGGCVAPRVEWRHRGVALPLFSLWVEAAT